MDPERFSNAFPSDREIPDNFRIRQPLIQREFLVNGRLAAWNGPRQQVYSPVHVKDGNGMPHPVLIGEYPLLTEKEALMALEAACKAFDNGRGFWPTLAVEERIRHMERFIRLMSEKREVIINLLMWEIGKNLADSTKEFDRTIDYIRDTIEALKDLDRNASRFTIQEGIIGQIRRSPLGVTLCMGPYNYPLNETFTTLIPALIMGNTVIFKPPKYGVLLHAPLLEALRDSFPPGVVNTVYGDGPQVVGPLMKSGRINILAFIGTSRVADILKGQHPKPHRLRSILGLEAKNAAIVMPDADLELAVTECMQGTLSFNGQRCTALKILFVHESIADTFNEMLCSRIGKMTAGAPWAEDVQVTPLPEAGKIDYLAGLVRDASEHGAMVLNEGGGTTLGAYFFPALLFPVNSAMKVFHDEQFGPVIPVVPYADLSEPLDYVTNSDYGQQISIFGTDPATIAMLVDPLVNQVCRVNINSQCQRGPDTFPFTGRKDSAEGTLSVSDALRAFSIRSLVAAKSNGVNKKIITTIVKDNLSNFISTDYIF
jgi:glyceraldehyde-3-phosphate dehydrogenase (NADP+)